MLPAARPDAPAISKSLLLGTLAALTYLGVDAERTLGGVGLKVEDLPSLPERLQPDAMFDLWVAAVEVSETTGLGLRVAAGVRLEQFATFGRVLAASSTLGDALARGTRLFRLISETQRLSVRLDGSRGTVVLETLHDRPVHPEAVEFLIGGIVTLGRRLSGSHAPPLEVHLRHDAPPHRGQVAEFFGCPVRYGASENAVTFDAASLLVPVSTYDPSRCVALQNEAEVLLADLNQPNVFRREVAGAISKELGDGHAEIGRVASRVGIHPKALARKLRAEGTTYRDLLDQVRLHLAQRYLETRGLGMTEIAFRLGYSEKSAFNRAFKRWTGQAPESYRQSEAPGPATPRRVASATTEPSGRPSLRSV